MKLKQPCNILLSGDQYREIKKLGNKLGKPYSELVREGVNFILKKYNKRKEAN